jgi:hypothetical protein
MTTTKALSWSLLIAAAMATGCSQNAGTPKNGGKAGKETKTQASATNDSAKRPQHAPHGAGPNGGVLFDLGKYHAEFTVDHPKKQCQILVIGDDEKTPTAVAAQDLTLTTKPTKTADGTAVPAMTIKLLPQDEKDGKATTFIGTDPGIGNVADFDGTVLGLIDGKPSKGEFSESQGAAGHAHGHSHGDDDALVWVGEPRSHAGLEIKLGHHGKHLHAGEEVEPAVSITRDGKPVSDAKVFNSLMSADGATVLAKEVATVYEPTTADEPAHYAQGGLTIPKDAKEAVIRFRIVPAEGEAATFDVRIEAK